MTTLEDVTRIARRVLGGAHPLTTAIELDLEVSRAKLDLEVSRAVLRAREAKLDLIVSDMKDLRAELRALEEETSSGGANKSRWASGVRH